MVSIRFFCEVGELRWVKSIPTRRAGSRLGVAKRRIATQSPASSRRLTCSEYQPQSELNEPGIVILAADDAKLRITELQAGRVELHSIEEVEDFRPELQPDPFGNGRVLEQREAVIGDARRAHIRHGARQIAEGEGRRKCESRLIEPSVQA